MIATGLETVPASPRKVEDGEDPDFAMEKVIGFDINPIAVSIARTELLLAYRSFKDKVITPLIFNTDSASVLIQNSEGKPKTASFLEELRIIEEEIHKNAASLISVKKADFSGLLKLEPILGDYFREVGEKKKYEELKEILEEMRREIRENILIEHIVDSLSSKDSVKAISSLLEKYGNGIWAVSITSLFAPRVIRRMKADVILTNPPWRLLTGVKGEYGDALRENAGSILKNYRNKARIMNSSDLATILLNACMKIADEVAFVMPKEVVYVYGSAYGLGKLLTYEVVRRRKGEILEFSFDAFQHGNLPCVVHVKSEKGNITCSRLEIGCEKYSKALHLSEIEIKEKEDYDEYIKEIKQYVEISSKEIKRKLKIEEVVPMGNYIRGLFGGTKKKEAKRYAGLVFYDLDFDKTSGEYIIRIHNIDCKIKVSEYFLSEYWKKLIYPNSIFPFHNRTMYNVFLSDNGENDLKNFLGTRIENKLTEENEKVRTLISELKQPKN